jgi:hypothetical protein
MRRLRHIVLAVVLPLAVAVVAPGAASAKGYQDVIHDCAQDGKLDHTYSHRELNQALHHIPSDIDEYTDCRDAITQALGQRGGGGTGTAPYNPSLTTDAGATAYNQNDYNSLKSQAKGDSGSTKAPQVALGSHEISVGKGPLFRNAAAANSIPPSLLGSLIAVGLLTLAGTTLYLTRRFPAVRRVALRIFRR